ncbi:transglycosylase SLT domain-containing protein [Desulfovibrio litoralis]|uniref:Membrane-bound lytic murein transglycosylase F n=1 Tax=Desulfovibrio litoralis DSM 11393 TaxID=1121455 RepID=A0A1M7TKC1_9BACT|nr:transglycosylase SLT domain-containing protein [Desulfovibrio litoralis]SHN71191.1 membrane-bound lytic murein transglycosylase F [Desulfovibrio litoralis DSM 11393]
MNKKTSVNRLIAFIRQIFTPLEFCGVLLFFIAIPLSITTYIYWEDLAPQEFNEYINIKNFTFNKYSQTHDKELTLRVAAPTAERIVSKLSPYGPGFEQELLDLFAEKYNLNIIYESVDSRLEAIELLRKDKVDLVIGFAGDLTYEDGDELTSGQVYFSPNSGKIISVEIEESDKTWYKNVSKSLSLLVTQVEKSLDEPLNVNTSIDIQQGPFVDEDSGMLDEYSTKLWQPFLPNLKVSFKGGEQANYRWIWRYDNPDFFPKLYAFWEELGQDNYISKLEEKYFGFLPTGTPPWASLHDLAKTVHSNLPEYKESLSKAASRYDVNPFLLVALIYQESRFDPNAQSAYGPLGLMQFTQATAQRLNVDPLNPTASIDAGAKYLKILWAELEKMDLEYWDRWFFTLAAYNQGPAHLQDAIALSKKMGGTGKTWLELKKVYPLLTKEEYYSQTKYGFCRGNEAVAYVEKIRYYIYVLNGMVSISRSELQNFALN